MYANYPYYVGTYHGSAIAEADFPRLAARASSYLDSICNVKDHQDGDAVKMAACAVAEAWQVNEQGGEVVSESVGRWSKSFASSGKGKSALLWEAAMLYLGPAGLLKAVEWA